MKEQLTMFRSLFLTSAAFILASCGTPSPEAQQEKFLKAKSDAINVEFTDKAVAESVVGFRAVTVSTVIGQSVLERNGSSQSDNEGQVKSDCKIQSKGYAASFVTPAVVNMPSTGRTTQPATLTCIYNGQTFRESYKPVNLSKGGRTTSALGVGVLLCPICGVAVAVGTAGEQVGDAFGFDEITLDVR